MVKKNHDCRKPLDQIKRPTQYYSSNGNDVHATQHQWVFAVALGSSWGNNFFTSSVSIARNFITISPTAYFFGLFLIGATIVA